MQRDHLHLHYLLRDKIHELYFMNAIRSFAISTILIFIPIFLYEKGFSLILIASYLLYRIIIGTFFCFTALKFVSKNGVRHAFFISIPLTVLFFSILYKFDFLILFGNFFYLFILGTLEAAYSAYFYMAFHTDFAKFSNSKKSLKQYGMVNIISTIFSILGPLFGGIIIFYFSFNVLFLIVICLMIISVFPLLSSKESHVPFKFKINNNYNFKDGLPFFSEGFQSEAASIYWPILMFLIAISINKIGFVYTISNIILVLVTIYIKKSVINKKKILRIGTIIHAFSLAVRGFLKTISLITLIQGIGAFSWTMVHIPFHSIFYNNSKKIGIASSIFYREIFLHGGRAVSMTILIVLLMFFDPIKSLIISLLISSVFTIFISNLKEI